jgi:hypothetical protein
MEQFKHFRNLFIAVTLLSASTALQAQDTIVVPCDGDTVFGSYCYTNNDDHTWYWVSACGAPVRVHFFSGTIESSPNDELQIFDGADNVAPLLFANGSNPGTIDLTGLNFVGNSGMLFMEMTSNATNCCATDNLMGTSWQWAVTSGSTVGIGEARTGGFTMYPNPARGVLYVDGGTKLKNDAEVRIMDVSGRVVYRGKLLSGLNSIDVRDLRSGTYTVAIETAEGFETQSLQVVH